MYVHIKSRTFNTNLQYQNFLYENKEVLWIAFSDYKLYQIPFFLFLKKIWLQNQYK